MKTNSIATSNRGRSPVAALIHRFAPLTAHRSPSERGRAPRPAWISLRAAACLPLAVAAFHAAAAAEPFATPTSVVTTNYVIVTNLALVTNQPSIINPQFSTNSALPALVWVPPADSFDWIQLKSGEWLKGRLKGMQDRKLEFDSEELNNLSFDWKDIRQLRSSRTIDVLSVDGKTISGPVAVTPDQVVVGSGETPAIPRDQLQSLTPGGSRERNYWSGNVSLGLTLRAGNTRSVEYNAQAHFQRRTPETRLSLDYLGNVSSFNGEESANNNRLNTEFNLWLSQRFYLVMPYAEYYKDPFQNLAHRATVGVGVGYDLIARPTLEWNVTTGPAYQYSWFESAEPGSPTEKGAAALTFGSRLQWDISHRTKLTLEYRGLFTSKEIGETTHHTVSTLSLELTKRFDLDVSFVWDRISQPKTGSDGIEPKPDDFRLVVGLGVDF